VRIAARFELAVDPDTLAAGRRMAPEIRAVSAERIAEELRKLLTHRNRARGVRLLAEIGLVGPILPELEAGDGRDRGARVVEQLGEPASFPLAFAALLHTLDRPTVEAVADRLRLSTAEKTRTAWLVENRRALIAAATMRPSRLKPILVHPGIGELLELQRADAVATGASLDHVAFCERYLRDTPAGELNPPPAVTGEDLIALGLKPGREFKTLLDAVREAQLDGRVRSKAEGLGLVRRLRSGPEPGPGAPPG
jgi:poly(A) polymerase